MRSIRDGQGRVPLPRQVEADTLRRDLMYLYRQDRRYRTITDHDLRIPWLKLAPQYGTPPDVFFWDLESIIEEQAWVEQDEGKPRDRELASYVDRVRRRVAKTMRLTAGGQPASWFTAFVHADVARASLHDRPLDPLEAFFLPSSEEATLWMRVTSMSGRLRVVSADGTTVAEQEIDARIDYSFNEWDAFRGVARKMVDEQIDRMERAMETALKVRLGKMSNLKSLEKQGHDLRLLFTWLFDPQAPRLDKNSRQRLRVLTQKIGIDLPRTPAPRR